LEGHWATPIFHDGYIYGCHGRHESGADIRCLDAKDGRVAWKSPRGLGRSTLLMVQEHIIVLGERGHVALLEVTPNAYTEVSRRKNVLGHPAWAPPVVANGLLYLRDEHQVVCLDLRPPQQ
jgi:outer membrane protein assembly factor BamB